MKDRFRSVAIVLLILMLAPTTMFHSHSGEIPNGNPSSDVSRGVTVVAGSSSGNVYVYDEAGKLLWSCYTGADVASVAVSSDGAYIVVGSLGNKLYLFNRDGTELWKKSVPIASGYGGGWMGTESRSVAISAHGEYVVAGCTDNLYVYKKDGSLLWFNPGTETCVDISPNGENIVSCNNYDGTIHFFSTQSNTPLWTKSMNAFWVATSDPGCVAASSHSTVYLYDESGTQLWSYHHSKWDSDFIRVDMPENGSSVVAVNDDPSDYPGCVLCYWNHLKDGTYGWSSGDSTPVWVFEPGGGPGDTDFYSVAISGNGDYIATGPSYGSYEFSSTSNVPLQTFDIGTGNSYGLTFDGQYGACGNRQGGFYYFSKDSGIPLWSKAIGGNVHAVAVAEYYIGDWPMFRHDPSHTGYLRSVTPDTNNTIWNYTTGSYVESSPAVSDGKVYVGSGNGKVYCLNATIGTYIWNYTTDSGVTSSPAFAYNKVYVGSWDRKVYCLNATTGTQIWNYTTGGSVRSSPAVVDGKVYVGSWDRKVYCLDAATGIKIWDYTTSKEVFSSPAVVDGKVYVGSWDRKVYCLNATTGTQIWNYTTGSYVESSPAVADGKIYVGSLLASHETVCCLNATTGTHIWGYTTDGDVISSPAVAYDKIYVGSFDRKVYCLNATTGTQIWNYTTGDYIESSPAIADDKVYLGSDDGSIYCLNATTGTEIWSYKTGSAVRSSPAVAYGNVYVGSSDCHVYAFGPLTLTITANTGGTTDPPLGAHTYMNGTIVNVTAIPSLGYLLDHWELDRANVGASNPIVITMNRNHILHAVFTYNVTIGAYCYSEESDVSVNITMDGSSTGYTTPYIFTNLTNTHSFTVPETDSNGHLFKQWNTGEINTTITVSTHGAYIAYYQARYNLAITTTEGGTTDPGPGNYSYWDGTVVSVTAMPPYLGYVFDHWELDQTNVGTSNPISVTMNANHTLGAVFSWVGICNLTITTTTGGTTNPAPGTYSYTNGTIASITADAAPGYFFSYWLLDGSNKGSINPILVAMHSNHVLAAAFNRVFPVGCPFLYVYDGQEYINEGLLNIHSPTGSDISVNHTLNMQPMRVGDTYLFYLVESPVTVSHLDQVALYAVLEDGTTVKLSLTSAWHKDQGNVLPQLLGDDGWRTDLLGAEYTTDGKSQSIQLTFSALAANIRIRAFIFYIDGNAWCSPTR
jgi:outer membrane protein assembly factor BamB